MTIQEASKRYMIPIKILKEYESWGLCGAVKKVMGAWQYQTLVRYLNLRDMGAVWGRGCGSPSMTKHSRYPQQAYELGRNLK